MWDRTICAARAAWYGAVEPMRLSLARSAGFSPVFDPLVSVLIPPHNRADLLLSRALPSVRAQTYKNLEIIVAAHGCTDATHWYVSGIMNSEEPPLPLLFV